MGEDERMLAKVVRALMAYYGPIAMIRAVCVETDQVIEEMATTGYIKEAKTFAKVVGDIESALRVKHT